MLTILHHLGLGDHIVCNGLVRHYAQKNQIKLYCKYKNFSNISQMFGDNNNIIIQPTNDHYTTLEEPYLKVGFENLRSEIGWDKAFYDQLELDFQISWELFKVNRNIEKENEIFRELNPDNKPYIFIHDTSIGQNVPRINLSGIRPEKHGFFDYIKILENADEIHCVNSSFIHLVDRIKTNGKLYYYPSNHPTDSITFRKNWTKCYQD